MSAEPIVAEISYLTGVKRLAPVAYRVTTRTVPHFRFWTRDEYYVESDFASMGPYATRAEAYGMMAVARAVG